MKTWIKRTLPVTLAALALVMAACQPAAPEPAPPAPPKPAEPAPPKPAEPAAKPAEPAAKPAEPAPKPAEPKPEPKVDAVADFYRGQTVRIIVGFSAGGGYDTYARQIARHLSRHIPGNPTIIVENMPGAGSLLSANHVYNVAPKDGTVMVTFIGGMITQKIIVENPAAEFEPLEFNWIGGPTPDTAACAVRVESGLTELLDARTQDMFVGGTAPGSTTNDIPSVLKVALGLDGLQLIDGYGGTADIRLAADRGELHGGCWGYESISVTWGEEIAAGNVIYLGQGGAQPHPDIPNVPHFLDIADTDEARQLIEAGIVAPGQISRTFALPPGVPQERVDAMRQAFLDTLNDPQLLAEAETAGLDIAPVPHTEFYERIQALIDLPDDVKDQLRSAVAP